MRTLKDESRLGTLVDHVNRPRLVLRLADETLVLEVRHVFVDCAYRLKSESFGDFVVGWRITMLFHERLDEVQECALLLGDGNHATVSPYIAFFLLSSP